MYLLQVSTRRGRVPRKLPAPCWMLQWLTVPLVLCEFISICLRPYLWCVRCGPLARAPWLLLNGISVHMVSSIFARRGRYIVCGSSWPHVLISPLRAELPDILHPCSYRATWCDGRRSGASDFAHRRISGGILDTCSCAACTWSIRCGHSCTWLVIGGFMYCRHWSFQFV
jgi:hypothetical protein